jgi:hypothetical protein
MAGIEILGVLSAFETCLHGSHQIHRFIRSYRQIENDMIDLDLRLEEANAYLWSFGRIHNLIVENDRATVQGSPVAVDVSPSWKKLADKRLVIARDHIQHAQTILSKYFTGIQPTDSQSLELQQHDEPESFETNMIPTSSPTLAQPSATLASRRDSIKGMGIRRKSTWSAKDKQDLTEAVTQFEQDVKALFHLTMPRFWILMHESAASALKKRIEEDTPPISLGGISMSLDEDQRISQELRALELVRSLEAESQEQKEARKLDFDSCFPELAREELPVQPLRTVVKCVQGGTVQQVLVEWKGYNPKEISRNEVISRVSDVVSMLNSPPSFLHNVLPSAGFFEDARSNNSPMNWVGIVYETFSLGNKRKLRTLRELLTRPSELSKRPHQDIWKPPLGDRFKLGLRIAETLLTTHNCGWLHKGIRPENIVFFTPSEKSIADPYLLGWEYSRSGKQGQKSEEVRTWNSDTDLYQHPDYFGGAAGPEEGRYRPYFDHYQLGCVLLEIGMWRLLGDLGRPKDVPVDDEWRRMWRFKLRDKAARLSVDMGEIYSGVVLDLLTGLNEDQKEREFWDAVVLRLSRCCA